MTGKKLLTSITQIALILLAALLVVGVTWQVGQGAEPERRGERVEAEATVESDDHNHGHERGERHEHSDEGEWLTLRGLGGFRETIIKLVIVISAVVFGQRGWASLQAKRAANSP